MLQKWAVRQFWPCRRLSTDLYLTTQSARELDRATLDFHDDDEPDMIDDWKTEIGVVV
jgi:hypothetical protein